MNINKCIIVTFINNNKKSCFLNENSRLFDENIKQYKT